MKMLLILAIVLFVIILSCRLFFSRRKIPVRMIDFSFVSLPDKKNYCFVYGDQTKNQRQLASTRYPVQADELLSVWQSVVAKTPRMQLLQAKSHQFTYLIHSRWLRFPDIVDVKIISPDNLHSQLYIYSRSVYGYYDFDVNCRRVKQWLQAVDHVLSIDK